MNGLVVAARYLTIVPLGSRPHAAGDALGRAAVWFPLVGLALGLVVAGVERLTAHLFPPLLSALLTITAWKVLTGGLHLDGLADCLDGLGGRDPRHRLAIMRDGRIGAFGAIGLILFLLLEIVAVAELAASARWRTLVLAPVAGRAMPVLLARLFAPAHREGQGAGFHAGLRPSAAPIVLGVAGVVGLVVLGLLGLVGLAVAVLASLGLARFLAHRLGGITGDVLGASVEASELVVLLTASAWAHARP